MIELFGSKLCILRDKAHRCTHECEQEAPKADCQSPLPILDEDVIRAELVLAVAHGQKGHENKTRLVRRNDAVQVEQPVVN